MTSALKTWSILQGGIESLDGSWPEPRLKRIESLISTQPPESVRRAAWEAREIVQAQSKAPNITSLFEKKLGEQRGA